MTTCQEFTWCYSVTQEEFRDSGALRHFRLVQFRKRPIDNLSAFKTALPLAKSKTLKFEAYPGDDRFGDGKYCVPKM